RGVEKAQGPTTLETQGIGNPCVSRGPNGLANAPFSRERGARSHSLLRLNGAFNSHQHPRDQFLALARRLLAGARERSVDDNDVLRSFTKSGRLPEGAEDDGEIGTGGPANREGRNVMKVLIVDDHPP